MGRPKRFQGDFREGFGEQFGRFLLLKRSLGGSKMGHIIMHERADNCSRGSYKTPPDIRTLPRTNQKVSPTPLNDDSTCRQCCEVGALGHEKI